VTASVDAAVDQLRRGLLVALPTETVYGLAADASDPAAVRRIFTVKGRPADHPVIVHIPDASHLAAWALDVPDVARGLTDALWPGPLTVVLSRRAHVPDAVTGGLDTVGLRSPAHDLALAVLTSFGGGVAAPSANRFGRVSPTTIDHVRVDLADEIESGEVLVLDGGPCRVGIESTIVSLVDPERPLLLRPGAIDASTIERIVGRRLGRDADPSLRAPGRLPSHYAPACRVELIDAADVDARAADVGGVALRHSRDLTHVAHTLYDAFRSADRNGAAVIVTSLVDASDPLGEAINDRLSKAAAAR
jgi:L-threonylcarbamoyladenylate synthase